MDPHKARQLLFSDVRLFDQDLAQVGVRALLSSSYRLFEARLVKVVELNQDLTKTHTQFGFENGVFYSIREDQHVIEIKSPTHRQQWGGRIGNHDLLAFEACASQAIEQQG
jgi:hypothetical protein